MKKFFYIPIAICILGSGCTKNLTDYNTNPKAPVTAPSAAVFLSAEKSLVDAVTSTSVSSAPFRILAQSWTENTYTYEARYNFSAYQAPDGWWNALYDNVLDNLYAAKNLYPTDVADPVALKNDRIITDLLEIYTYNLLVNTYGNIPYSQAENRLIPFPKYDDAKTVFNDLLTRVDTCIAGLNTGGSAMGGSDQIYGGNVAKWLKFAASLKLKLSMYLADVDAATFSKKVGEAIQTGLFASNSDNAVMTYDPSTVGNSNPIWQAMVNSGRHDFCPAAYMVNTLSGLNDPRLSLYYNTDPNGKYTGGIAGNGNSYSTLSTFSNTWLAANYPGDLLDYSEVAFDLAEAAARGVAAAGTAATNYNNAITASVVFWGGTTASATTYLAQPTVAWSASANYKQQIGYQEWIAFANRNWDSWTLIRRLKYPNLDVVSPPTGATGNLPLRFTYPNLEVSSNPTNWAAAVKAVTGGSTDIVSAKLFWE
ncbi:SusD/RagB family nutrient-binding outer membrane lipoprotein [Puia dinghuensis]|uniref:SusD/RagB family nutrient-binding outer membrane lipoprotein n=1 Tax=Puia dinghuensis TaxID=1792502 RepID=A0A8J2XWA3_9BACT|nr:SusD/RagB family nutrient-binding outer membrane lipoprotein [Puia dinghuensis]GGB22487.1 hypothetical protein GCM10011511_53010 [Puia dinghuensis]